VPSLTSKKAVLQQWLTDNNIAFHDDFLRVQLIDLINQHRPPRVFKLDHMLRNDPLDIIGNLILNNRFRSVLYSLQTPLSSINNYRKLTPLSPLIRGATVKT